MHIPSFSIARLPRIEFGCGVISKLPETIKQYGNSLLLVTGSGSIDGTDQWQQLLTELEAMNIAWHRVMVCEEPSPQLVDDVASQYRSKDIDAVVGLGGGSVLDAAKAIAGLLRLNHSVMDFLEGVGPELPYQGPCVPFIAAPTTAGTGSEATKNSVLSKNGENGFKKSFRDDQLVAEYAIVDPDLLATCSAELIAANGMDAMTQLLESFVSTRSNDLTDALAVSGLRACRNGLLNWYQGNDVENARTLMAYASLLSGINLAQTGLGSVHGLASPLGAYFPIPHGVVCGTLVATCTRVNIEAMQEREPDNPALDKYARTATLLCNKKFKHHNDAFTALNDCLQNWTDTMQLKRLSEFDVKESDFDKIIKNSRGSSMKTNPIVLTDNEVKKILTERL